MTRPNPFSRNSSSHHSPEGGSSAQNLGMIYFDTLPARITRGRDSSYDYRPAYLSFPTERSHKAAATILRALDGEESPFYKQMVKQIAEKDDPRLAPGLELDPTYDWRSYRVEDARSIRRKIGVAATWNLDPELRPEGVAPEVAEAAYYLDQSAPSLNQPPRNPDEEFLEITTRQPQTQAAIDFENARERATRVSR